ncbi:protein SMAX1-LIKE 4-like [Tasmannia lanceolata]|uniref:protein SMAX1-LIKE 4-like n=1 Tax=Tasmannia lanceolata TaxID=3420 RepID=UPI00406434E4
MRAGACTVQQTLTSEAASVLRHSVSLARRRGHAQVTPLHVAATLLSSRLSLLRRACLKSHPHSTSHPLQCRALELCFNVALNRLPTTPGPLLHGQPSLSNALIAALKRAQAHQRRGCIEQQQQQPLLAIKVELEQLIISILDDPSVSRVMREAGFSSTSVKNNLEDSSVSSVFQCYSSGGVLSSTSERSHREIISHSNFWQTQFLNSSAEQNPVLFSTPKKQISTHFIDSGTEKEDIKLVLEVLLRKKRRNTVVVGDSLSSTEGLVTELMGKVERGEVPELLRSVHFIKFQLSSASLRFMKRDDVDMKVADLRRKVSSVASSGAIIYAGDLKWAIEEAHVEKGVGVFSVGEVLGYNPVDHIIAELGRLVSDFTSYNNKVWLMATANYQTYMKCQMKTPPLEIQWGLQAVPVSGGLALSLHASSILDSRAVSVSQNPSQMLESKPLAMKEEQEKLVCCAECTSNFEKEAGIVKSAQQKPSSLLSFTDIKDNDRASNHLPYWLQQHKTDNNHKDIFHELRRKWNRLCESLHHPRHNQIQLHPSLFNESIDGKSYSYASSYPRWSTGLQYNQNNIFGDSNSTSYRDSASKGCSNSNFMANNGDSQGFNTQRQHPTNLSLDPLSKTEIKDVKITLALGSPLFSDSVTSLNQRETITAQDLCRKLQENIPWQSETLPSITEALLNHKLGVKKGNWLLIQGNDWVGKRRLARAIAESLCGSIDRFVHMDLKSGDKKGMPCAKILIEALRNNASCVVLMEEIDYADTQFIELLTNGFEGGIFEDTVGKEVCSAHAIFIMTTTSSTKFENSGEKPNSVIQMNLQFEEKSADLIASNKRKAEWDLSNYSKKLRKGEKEDPFIIKDEETTKKQFSRQSSANSLDLNVCAEDSEEDQLDESSAVPSDITQETEMGLRIPHGFLESIENRFVFDMNPTQFCRISEKFTSKLNASFEEACNNEGRRWGFCIDGMVLEELIAGSPSFLDSLFEKWLKDVFQTSFQTVRKGGKEGVVRLSLEGKEENVLEFGFLGSNLPNRIQVAL